MDRPNIMIDGEIRPMTDEEIIQHNIEIANAPIIPTENLTF